MNEEENTYTQEELREVIEALNTNELQNEAMDKITDNIADHVSFHGVDTDRADIEEAVSKMIEENNPEESIDKVINGLKEEGIETSREEIVNSIASEFVAENQSDLESIAANAVQSGYEEKHDISDAVKENEGWHSELQSLEADTATLGDFAKNEDNTHSVEFSENLSIVSEFGEENSNQVMTREEGIEAALEAGFDKEDIERLTSKEEVSEAIDKQELSNSEINVEGDHSTIKEDTMSGEESERVVDRETALNEMDKAAGVDSDKVETKEETAERDNLSVEEKEDKLVEIAETTTDKEVLDRLADTDSDKVQEAVANNENTSEETREKIESKEETQEQSQGMSH